VVTLSNNNSYVSIKIREDDKIYLEDLKRRRGKKLHEVVSELIEAHRFVETLMNYLDCKNVDEVIQILSNVLPKLHKIIIVQKISKIQKEIWSLSEDDIIAKDEAEKIDVILGRTLDRLLKKAKA